MQAGQMVDVWSVLPTFTSQFQVRVQVFQHVAAGPATILPPRLLGPPLDQDGNPTPVLHLYWRGEHFEPLFAPDTVRLPVRVPLGGGPPATAAQSPVVQSPGAAQPPSPTAGATAPQPAPFGPVVSRPRRGQHDPSAGRFTQRLGGDVLDGLRRRVLEYMDAEGMPSSSEGMVDALVAVLAEAENPAGAGPQEEWWYDLVTEGLTIMRPAYRQASFYAGSLPGVDAGMLERLSVGREVTVDGFIHARTTPVGFDGDTLFVITSTSGRDVSRLAGGGSDLVMFDRGRRFEVIRVTQEPGGRRVIDMRDSGLAGATGQGAAGPAEPGSRPMPLPPADFEARSGSGAAAGSGALPSRSGPRSSDALPETRSGAGTSHSMVSAAGPVPGSATTGLRIDPGFPWDDPSDEVARRSVSTRAFPGMS
jgi:hypothetical protein